MTNAHFELIVHMLNELIVTAAFDLPRRSVVEGVNY